MILKVIKDDDHERRLIAYRESWKEWFMVSVEPFFAQDAELVLKHYTPLRYRKPQIGNVEYWLTPLVPFVKAYDYVQGKWLDLGFWVYRKGYLNYERGEYLRFWPTRIRFKKQKLWQNEDTQK